MVSPAAVIAILVGAIFHGYRAVPADQVVMQPVDFSKNNTGAYGVLVLAAFGPGAISVDAQRGG